jgi:hypothetical protein
VADGHKSDQDAAQARHPGNRAQRKRPRRKPGSLFFLDPNVGARTYDKLIDRLLIREAGFDQLPPVLAIDSGEGRGRFLLFLITLFFYNNFKACH